MNDTDMVKKNARPVTLIAGCGDVGSRLALQLQGAGHRVYGLRRSIAALPEGVFPIAADLSSGDLGEWPDHIDYVVYSAAAEHRTEDAYRKIYVESLMDVVGKIKSYPQLPKRIFFTSSTAVYHQQNDEWVDELSESHPKTFNGQIMLEAERLLLDSGLPATVVRFGGIYGPGRSAMLSRIQRGEVYAREPVCFGNRIHADDCAGLLAWLIGLDRKNFSVQSLYLGVDCDPAPLGEVTHWLAELMGIQPTAEVVAEHRGSKRCSNQRIVEAGYPFQYPSYKEGYRALLDD